MRHQNQMRGAIAVALLAGLSVGAASAQIIRVPPVRTVAALGACSDGSPKLVAVTDGASIADCATGGGSTEVICQCKDGSWSAAGGVTGLTSCASGTAIADNAALRGDSTTGCQGSDLVVGDVASSEIPLSSAGGNVIALPASVRFGTGGPRVKGSGTRIELRSASDAAYAPLTVNGAGAGLAFDGTGATNGALRVSAAATPVFEFITGDQSDYARLRADAFVHSGQCFVATDQTNATTTPASTTCSASVRSGLKYAGKCAFYLSDSVAAEGAAIDFDGGSATASNFRGHCKAFDSALALSTQTSALATDVAASTFTGAGEIECDIAFEPSGSGTFIPRFMQVTHAAGTLTLARGSHCTLWQYP